MAQNFLDFMQFFRKFDKIVCWRPPRGSAPLLQGILDPPLPDPFSSVNASVNADVNARCENWDFGSTPAWTHESTPQFSVRFCDFNDMTMVVAMDTDKLFIS